MDAKTTGTSRAEAAIVMLRRQGERVTAARRAVIDVLDSTTEHLTADEIAVRAAASAPGVHRTTVYRALTTLGDLGLVSHTHVAGSATIYHLMATGQHHAEPDHAHAQCTTCNRIIDIDEGLLEPLAQTLRQDIDFRVAVHHAALLGTCSSCATKV